MKTGVVGRRLMAARRRREWSQEQLAARAGVNRSCVTKIERGIVADPRFETVSKLARALDLSLDQLMAGKS